MTAHFLRVVDSCASLEAVRNVFLFRAPLSLSVCCVHESKAIRLDWVGCKLNRGSVSSVDCQSQSGKKIVSDLSSFWC